MSDKVNLIAETASVGASRATIGGGFAGAAAFFAGINWIGWLSLGIAILGLMINWYFSWLRNKREQEIHELTKRKLQDQCNAKKD